MKILKIKVLALAIGVVSFSGLASCNKGTEPGETNVERSEIVEPGSMIGSEETEGEAIDTTNYERHYDKERGVIGDGAYDGPGDGIERDEVE